MKVIKTSILASIVTVVINAWASPAVTQEVDRHSLCSKFPLNSRCENFPAVRGTPTTYKLNRDRFCQKFALNSRCQQPPQQVIKLNLDSSGEDNEWVRLEKQDNKVTLFHTTKVKDGLVSGALNGALGLVPVPIPLPFVEANKYNWENHLVTSVSFKSDRCNTKKCVVTGKNSLSLPGGTNIYGGKFTIEYREQNLERSLSFRIPANVKAQTVNTITITGDR